MYDILDMSDRSSRTAKTIRMREEVYHRARVAAVISKKSLGQWIEEAVLEKERREAVHSVADFEGRLNPGQSVEKGSGMHDGVVA